MTFAFLSLADLFNKTIVSPVFFLPMADLGTFGYTVRNCIAGPCDNPVFTVFHIFMLIPMVAGMIHIPAISGSGFLLLP